MELTQETIRREREARGWSYAEAARMLKARSRTALPNIDSLTRQWKRWERGQSAGRLYGPLLMALLTDTDVDEPHADADREFIDAWAERAAVPRETWLGLIQGACEGIDVLAFSATFFHQLTHQIADLLGDAAARGAQVRLCFAHPESEALAVREREERLLDVGQLATKARTTLGYYRPLVDVDGCELRLHRATVYASLFRFDDVLMANPHVFGAPANGNPLLHTDAGSRIFKAYSRSFEAVWDTAEAWTGQDV